MPLSIQEFNQAWNELCALEIKGVAWRPSPALLWKVWKSIMATCSIENFSLDAGVDTESLGRIVEEDDVPVPVFKAVIARLQGHYVQPSDQTIVFGESGLLGGKSTTAIAHAKAVGPNARKWHEKFKNTRR
ncbi:MAG: hypothetical protein Q9222_006138 [Ikaeria aurantiellina]